MQLQKRFDLSMFHMKLNPFFTKGPFKYYVSKEVGGVRKWQFLLIYSTIYANLPPRDFSIMTLDRVHL